jgi:hypothetical protein
MTINECGAVGRMTIGMENPSTRRKSAPVPRYPPLTPQIRGYDPGSQVGDTMLSGIERLILSWEGQPFQSPQALRPLLGPVYPVPPPIFH